MLLLLATAASAQTDSLRAAGRAPWEEYLAALYAGDAEDAEAMEEAYEHLTELEQRPMDINTARSDELMLIPGLGAEQANDIIEYRERHGKMKSIEELGLIASIDYRLRLFLLNFLCVKDGQRQAWRMRGDMIYTAEIPTYYRAGDRHSGSKKYEGKYLGDPLKHSLRCRMDIGDRMTLSLTGSKAAGEPFFSHGNRYGYDRYNYSLSITPKGFMRRIIIGQYRAQLGMGLVMNNGFTLGKQAMLSSVGRMANAFTPHSGTTDSRHLQGIAATADIGRWTTSAFASYRYIDATLNADNTISTILTSNYHRTEKDMEKKANSTQMALGGHAGYSFRTQDGLHGSLGASAVYTHLNRSINPVYSKADTVSDAKKYRLYYPTGDTFWNASIDYRLRYGYWSLTGETATGNCHAVATINTLSCLASRHLTLTAIQRFYPYQYHAIYGAAFSEGGAVQNESGLYIGARWMPSQPLVIDIYSDVAYFPWRKYLVSKSSRAWDNSATATYNHGKWAFSARYRFKTKQRDMTYTTATKQKEKRLANRTEQRLRLTAAMTGSRWSTKTQLEGCHFAFSERNKGFIASQSATYKPSARWCIYAFGAYFNADDYDARLYSYERGMLYTFSYRSYYGRGLRAALLVKADFSRKLSATLKAGHTRYFDRSTIGSAERMIDSNHQTDIDLQLRVKL